MLCRDKISLSQQSSFAYLQPFMLRQKKDCRDKVPLPFALIIDVTELRVLRQSSLHSSLAMSRQKTLCRDRNSIFTLSLAWTLIQLLAVT